MAEMPSGAVTFLFTDIEGSTQLVKQLRERYGVVLGEHQRLLRAAFEAHGGYEVDTQGDSFFVAFASAREAVLAAVEGQLALRSHAWPDGIEIRVRMGLHTGQAVAADGRYTGLAVHRAARIGAAGHGGQILVSQATQTLLEDEEENLHVQLQDLGEQRLKDLARPVRLYQAVAEGLVDSFPPVRGDTPPATAAPSSRRRLLAALAIAVAAAAALAVFLVLRGGGESGLGGVQANHVGVIDPETNLIVDEIQVGVGPGPVAGGDGFVWVGNVEDQTLTRIDPADPATPRTFPLGKTPSGIAVGLGSVWVAHGLLGDISLVDPQFGEVTSTVEDVGGTAFGSPNGAVALDEGSAWVVFGDSTLAHLDSGGTVLGKTTAGARPAGVVAADGSVWVTNSGDANVQRFNVATFSQGEPLATVSVPRQPTGIVHADGLIWVASAGGIVTRIDPNAEDPVQIPVDEGASAIASGAEAIWVTSTTAGTVSRIDPVTNTVVAKIETGNEPTGISFANGLVWVAVRAP